MYICRQTHHHIERTGVHSRVKLQKLYHHPLTVLGNRWSGMLERVRFARSGGYRERAYWEYRHTKYGFDLRGVGNKIATHEENSHLLSEGSNVLLEVCGEAQIGFGGIRALDIGCGTGYFAGILRDCGVRNYRGIDIVDTLFKDLRSEYPTYGFDIADISRQPLEGDYDLILVMDVLQHIPDEARFRFAVSNICSVLAPGGTIIVSTYIGALKRESFYLIRRPMEIFDRLFVGFVRSVPRFYAESQVFSLRRMGEPAAAS